MKTRYIKYLALPLMLASAWSCTDMTEEAVNEVSGGSTVKEIVLQLPELKTADTRTEFTVDEVNKTLKTAWAEDDVAGIFPTTGYNQVEFPISDAWGESVARFDGGDWALRANKSYAAYFPFNKANFERDASSIILSYEGQVQSENGSVSHLSDYDYLATGASQSDPYGSICFQMQRLSGIARFAFTLPENEDGSFTKLFLKTESEVFDLEESLNITENAPMLETAKSAHVISMALNNLTADENHQLIVYMTLPPMNVEEQVQLLLMKEDGSMLVTTSDGISIEKSHVEGFAFSEFETLENEIINFVDPEVKSLCLSAGWDLNNDDELSITEAALVTDLGEVFRNSSIESFNELEYFTGLTNIAKLAFDNCNNLTAITIPQNVISIGDRAFQRCSNLSSITFPEGLLSIGYVAFFNCRSLSSIIIPKSVVSLNSPFSDCDFTSIIVDAENEFYDSRNDCNAIIETSTNKLICGCKNTLIPDGVISLEWSSFSGASLTSLNIPESVTSIGGAAFSGCSNLSEITIPNNMTYIGFQAFRDCENLASMTIPENVTGIGHSAFSGCTNLASVSVLSVNPPSIENNVFDGSDCPIYVPSASVNVYKEAWPEYADRIYAINEDPMDNFIVFSDPEVKRICVEHWDTNGDGELSYKEAAAVTSISDYFYQSSITSFDEFKYFVNVTYMEGPFVDEENSDMDVTFYYGAFEECEKLESITFPTNLKRIADRSFYGCKNLAGIKIPKYVTEIGNLAFAFCTSLDNVVIPYGVYYLSDTFAGCTSLTTVDIPISVKTLSGTFSGCTKLESIEIPNSVTALAAFAGCINLKDFNIPESVTKLGGFANTNFTEFDIPESVTTIYPSAFSQCRNLTKVTIPESVTEIHSEAFQYCDNLEDVVIPSGIKKICAYAFDCDLNKITILAEVPPTFEWSSYYENDETDPFIGSYKNRTYPIYVPKASVDAYKAALPRSAERIRPIE